MTDIEFRDSQYTRLVPDQSRRSAISSLVIKTGLADDDAGAQKVLLSIFVLAILGILAAFIFGSDGTAVNVPFPPTS